MTSSATPGSDQKPGGEAGRRRKRGPRLLAWAGRLLLLLAIAVPVSAAVYRFGWPDDAERDLISLQRFWRASFARFGVPLPGTPDLADLDGRLAQHGLAAGNPVLIRIFKREFELEVWMMRDGRFHHFATYPVCKWSGGLGPKLKQGDRQAPEGFYTVDATQLNPNSAWHRSFNLGFPNAFDQARGRTGSLLMVHGGCGSIGCYAMTNPVIDEIWRLITSALDKGQPRFQVQVLPFRLTKANVEQHAGSPNGAFWAELKAGYDLFEASSVPPKVSVCGAHYAFAAGPEGYDGSGIIAAGCPTAQSTGAAKP